MIPDRCAAKVNVKIGVTASDAHQAVPKNDKVNLTTMHNIIGKWSVLNAVINIFCSRRTRFFLSLWDFEYTALRQTLLINLICESVQLFYNDTLLPCYPPIPKSTISFSCCYFQTYKYMVITVNQGSSCLDCISQESACKGGVTFVMFDCSWSRMLFSFRLCHLYDEHCHRLWRFYHKPTAV